MRDTPAMLRELSVIEQRYRAVLQVLDGIPVTEVGPWPTALLGPRIAAWEFLLVSRHESRLAGDGHL
jgi:hypothetical protein